VFLFQSPLLGNQKGLIEITAQSILIHKNLIQVCTEWKLPKVSSVYLIQATFEIQFEEQKVRIRIESPEMALKAKNVILCLCVMVKILQ
jgi:hypothetical protein